MAGEDPVTTEAEGPTRKGKVVVLVTAFAGTLMIELVDGLPTSLPQWLLLVGGAALMGLLAGSAVLGTLRFVRSQIWVRRRALTLLLSAGLALALVYLTGPPAFQLLRHSIFGCPPAVELTVLTSPSGLNPSAQLMDRYEQWTAERNGGCATVNALVYAATATDTRAGIKQRWKPEDKLEPLRDIGPQPDIWLPDSGSEVNLLDERVRQLQVARDELMALSPVVLGVRKAVAVKNDLPQDGWSWPTLFDRLMNVGIGVVRPDPRLSSPDPDPQFSPVGSLATAALYGDLVELGGSASGHPVPTPHAIEQWIGKSLDNNHYPFLDSPELLCHHRLLDKPEAAVILSEQDLIRFNQGSPLGGACGAADRHRLGDDQMIAFYPQTIALDHRFVEFTWTPAESYRAEKITELRTWLTTEERGHQALEEIALRPPNAPLTSSLFTEQGAQHDPPFQAVEIDTARIEKDTSPVFKNTQRRSRTLLLLDVSGSMKKSAPPDTETRLSAVTKEIRNVLLSPELPDELGLWLFPGDPLGRTINQAVPVGPLDGSRTQAVSETLAEAQPLGNTPLFRAVVDGVAELGPSDSSTVNKLVVISDGEDTTSDLTAEQTLARVQDGNVRVFVIAVGDISCDAVFPQPLTNNAGVICYPAAPSEVSKKLAEIITS